MPRWSAWARASLLAALACTVTAWTPLGAISTALAASPSQARSPSAAWHVVETDNLRVLSYGTEPISREIAEACEQMRGELARQWTGDGEPKVWSPKCDVVLHPTDAAYHREVGSGGRNTVASALIDRQGDKITRRRIDVRATRPNWQTTALAHEMAHVVLADRFAEAALPRWLDEGMAILADPHEKRQRHRRAAMRAIHRGAAFRVAELLALADYPPAERWSTFYGQSASLVEYLVEQQGHGRFVDFVELALSQGYDAALRQVYGFGISTLERQWRAELVAPAASTAGGQQRNRIADSLVSTSAG